MKNGWLNIYEAHVKVYKVPVVSSQEVWERLLKLLNDLLRLEVLLGDLLRLRDLQSSSESFGLHWEWVALAVSELSLLPSHTIMHHYPDVTRNAGGKEDHTKAIVYTRNS